MIYLYNPWRRNAAKAAIVALEQQASFKRELYGEKSFYYQKDLKDAGNLAVVTIDSDDEVVDLSSLDEEEAEAGEDRDVRDEVREEAVKDRDIGGVRGIRNIIDEEGDTIMVAP
jgi:hypothetical protein